MPIVEKAVTIVNKLGLHARPAAMMVQEASAFSSHIELKSDELQVNGKSIMGVMMLAAAYGSELTIIADGDDADRAVAALESLINRKFDEE